MASDPTTAACNRDPNEVEALLRERGLGETVCPDDGLRPGEHGWPVDSDDIDGYDEGLPE